MAEPLPLQTIEERLCTEIQVVLTLKPGSIQPGTTLQSLGMDSLRLVSLLIAVEKTFGVNLMEVGLKREALQSVRSLAAAIFYGQPR
jgi:acyl carrier protein